MSSASNKKKRDQQSLQHEIQELKRKLAKKSEDVTKFKETVEAIESSTNAKQMLKKTMNKTTQLEIKKAIKLKLWPKIKFLADERQEKQLTKMVFKAIGYKDKSEAFKQRFIAQYTDFVVRTLNAHRTYIVSQLEKPVFALLDKRNVPLEDPNRILACLQRTLNPDDAEDLGLFTWYWDKYLPKVTGSLHLFAKAHRHYATISDAGPLNDPTIKYLTPQDEAFAVLVYESNRDKWMYFYQLKKNNRGLKLVPCKRKLDGSVGKDDETEIKGEELRIYGTKAQAKYTVADAGQSKFGGWSKAGQQRFVDLKKMAKDARKTANCKTLEERSLQALRLTLKLTHATHEEELKSRRKKNLNDDDNDEPRADTWGSDIEPSEDELMIECDDESDQEEI